MHGLSEWLKARRSAGLTVNMDVYPAKEVEQFDADFYRPRQAQLSMSIQRQAQLSLSIEDLRKTVEKAQFAVETARDACVNLKSSNAMIQLAKDCQDNKLRDYEEKIQIENFKLTSNLEKMEKELRLTGGMAMTVYLKQVYKRTQDSVAAQVGEDMHADSMTSVELERGHPSEEPHVQKESHRNGQIIALQKLSCELLMAKTCYDMTGWKGFAALKTKEGWEGFLQVKIAAMKKKRSHLSRDEKELERILEELEKLSQSVTKSNWDEVTDLWELMYDRYRKVEGERVLLILEQLFADKEIRRDIGAAKQLHDIAQPHEPPEGVIKLLKQAKGRLKVYLTDYVKAANREIQNIQRIRNQQNRLVGAMSFGLFTAATAIGNTLAIGSLVAIGSAVAVIGLLFIFRDLRNTIADNEESGKTREVDVKDASESQGRGNSRKRRCLCGILVLLAPFVLGWFVLYGGTTSGTETEAEIKATIEAETESAGVPGRAAQALEFEMYQPPFLP
jgi:hypothetical protein